MKENFFMAIAIVISGTVAAQTNTNISANASATVHVKTDAVKQTKARAKNEGKAALTTVAEKNDDLQTETSNTTGVVKQKTSVSGGSNASVNGEKIAADVATANQVKTEAIQATESNISKEGKPVVNSTFETKKDLGTEARSTVTVVKQSVSGGGENSASVKAGKKVKADASSSQEVKVKPSSIGVRTRVTSASVLNLR